MSASRLDRIEASIDDIKEKQTKILVAIERLKMKSSFYYALLGVLGGAVPVVVSLFFKGI